MTEQEREAAIEELLCYAECFITGNHKGMVTEVCQLSPLASKADESVASVRGREAISVPFYRGYGDSQGCYKSWCTTDALEAAHLLMEGWEPGEEVVRL